MTEPCRESLPAGKNPDNTPNLTYRINSEAKQQAAARPRRGPPPKESLQTEEGCTSLARRLGVSRQRAHQLMHRDAARARTAVRDATRDGRLQKSPYCQRCGVRSDQLEAHHRDYALPLSVIWLCRPCHTVVHPRHRGACHD